MRVIPFVVHFIVSSQFHFPSFFLGFAVEGVCVCVFNDTFHLALKSVTFRAIATTRRKENRIL